MPPIRKSTLPDGAAWTPKPAPKRISVPACPNFLRVGPEDKPDYRSVGSFDPEGIPCPLELQDGYAPPVMEDKCSDGNSFPQSS